MEIKEEYVDGNTIVESKEEAKAKLENIYQEKKEN